MQLDKQFFLMKLIYFYYEAAIEALEKGVKLKNIVSIKSKQYIARFKFLGYGEFKLKFEQILNDMKNEFENLIEGG